MYMNDIKILIENEKELVTLYIRGAYDKFQDFFV